MNYFRFKSEAPKKLKELAIEAEDKANEFGNDDYQRIAFMRDSELLHAVSAVIATAEAFLTEHVKTCSEDDCEVMDLDYELSNLKKVADYD